MYGFGVGLGQSIGGVHRGVRRHAEKQKLASSRQQDFRRRTGTISRRRRRHILTDHGIELAKAPQCFAGDGARKTRVAHLKRSGCS